MKDSRQKCILELIQKYEIGTQHELEQRLDEAGCHAAQATISRDLKRLNLKKVTLPDGRQKYVQQTEEPATDEKYIQVLKNGYVSMDQAMNLVVIRTVPGMAMAVAAALDHLPLEGVVGCIAGDDTIMCATKSIQNAAALMKQMKELL